MTKRERDRWNLIPEVYLLALALALVVVAKCVPAPA